MVILTAMASLGVLRLNSSHDFHLLALDVYFHDVFSFSPFVKPVYKDLFLSRFNYIPLRDSSSASHL